MSIKAKPGDTLVENHCFIGFISIKCNSLLLQYLDDLKKRGARILIGEFYESAARHILCEAYKQGMTQKQGYVWFLPNWYQFYTYF